eukprot:CAMPEP_0170758778 /NCGR_PEP_ID=MMETSP0733-20121128/530_1 /TAXON_ID=186038 /ORGANISM="Fragilariopsis kerguelensis, Strain L26-C5" /LENGTH=521 /DNA_ID=CAMNT_0011098139 /DNA_START=170 /DNA_END=1732 /DNA_ORIENTATION=-
MDDTSTVNNTSDGETTFASDDPFSLFHTKGHSKLFGTTDDDSSLLGSTRRSWSHTDETLFSNTGSSYEDMPFMISSSSNNNNYYYNIDRDRETQFLVVSDNNHNNIDKNKNGDDNENDDERNALVMEQNERPLAPSTLVNNIVNDDTSVHLDEANNNYACEMPAETIVIFNKFVNGAILAVQTAFGFCYDQVDGVLIRLYNVNSNKDETDKDNDIDNEKIENEDLAYSISPINKEKNEERNAEDNITNKQETPVTIAESKAIANESERDSDSRNDSNIDHYIDSYLNNEIAPPHISTALSNDSTNESILRFREYYKNHSDSKETTKIKNKGRNDGSDIATPLVEATKQNNNIRNTSVTKENIAGTRKHERTSKYTLKKHTDRLGNRNLNNIRTTTNQLGGIALSHVDTTSQKDTSLPVPKTRRTLSQLSTPVSTVLDQLPDMMREEDINSKTRMKKVEMKSRLNSYRLQSKTIEGPESRDDRIELCQNTTSIQHIDCRTQEEYKPEVPIDLTMMEDIFNVG